MIPLFIFPADSRIKRTVAVKSGGDKSSDDLLLIGREEEKQDLKKKGASVHRNKTATL